jgi:hypothetical protein
VGGGAPVTTTTTTTTGTDDPLTITGLTNRTTYTVTVAAKNAQRTGPADIDSDRRPGGCHRG